jgi:SAM-dependent methyltransferase
LGWTRDDGSDDSRRPATVAPADADGVSRVGTRGAQAEEAPGGEEGKEAEEKGEEGQGEEAGTPQGGAQGETSQGPEAPGPAQEVVPAAALAALVARAAARYAPAGRGHWAFAQLKLRFDPLYLTVLRDGLLPSTRSLVDLGCGRGLLLALLATARAQYAAGAWPGNWPAPPRWERATGVEPGRRARRAAARALGGDATIVAADLATYDIPRCDALILTDVLHYLPAPEQPALLERAAAALEPGGVLLIREADASAGARFVFTAAAERVRAWSRGAVAQRFHYRPAAEWRGLLEARGLAAAVRPIGTATPFGNVLIVARRAAPSR